MMDLTSRPPLAGILLRFVAVLLDGLIPSLILLPLSLVGYVAFLSMPAGLSETMLTITVFMLLLTCVGLMCYSATVLALWAYGLTPGMWMLGIQVIKRETGLPAGFWRMALRQIIGRTVASIICFLGFIWALFDANRQGWHDKIAKTLVIRTR